MAVVETTVPSDPAVVCVSTPGAMASVALLLLVTLSPSAFAVGSSDVIGSFRMRVPLLVIGVVVLFLRIPPSGISTVAPVWISREPPVPIVRFWMITLFSSSFTVPTVSLPVMSTPFSLTSPAAVMVAAPSMFPLMTTDPCLKVIPLSPALTPVVPKSTELSPNPMAPQNILSLAMVIVLPAAPVRVTDSVVLPSIAADPARLRAMFPTVFSSTVVVLPVPVRTDLSARVMTSCFPVFSTVLTLTMVSPAAVMVLSYPKVYVLAALSPAPLPSWMSTGVFAPSTFVKSLPEILTDSIVALVALSKSVLTSSVLLSVPLCVIFRAA